MVSWHVRVLRGLQVHPAFLVTPVTPGLRVLPDLRAIPVFPVFPVTLATPALLGLRVPPDRKGLRDLPVFLRRPELK